MCHIVAPASSLDAVLKEIEGNKATDRMKPDLGTKFQGEQEIRAAQEKQFKRPGKNPEEEFRKAYEEMRKELLSNRRQVVRLQGKRLRELNREHAKKQKEWRTNVAAIAKEWGKAGAEAEVNLRARLPNIYEFLWKSSREEIASERIRFKMFSSFTTTFKKLAQARAKKALADLPA